MDEIEKEKKMAGENEKSAEKAGEDKSEGEKDLNSTDDNEIE